MTGGQIAPALHDSKTSDPYGNPEQPFDIAKLVAAAGYIRRQVDNQPPWAHESMKGDAEPGSLHRVLSQCPAAGNMLGVRAPAKPQQLLEMLAEYLHP
jgi:hypothetical protein